MIDLHIHLLHEIDDGPTELRESLEMIELASQLGFSKLVATPHLLDRLDTDYGARVDNRLRELEPAALERRVGLQSGFEVRLTPDIGRRLQDGERISLAGSRTVLVELHFSGWPIFTEHALFDIQAAGFIPLLAHPERYQAAIVKPQLLLDLHERGVLMQITTGSLAGLFGKPARLLAEELLRAGAAEILASDAHSAGRRFESVAEGLARAEQIVGQDRLHQLTVENPAALLSDQPLPPSLARNEQETTSQARARPWKLMRNVLSGR